MRLAFLVLLTGCGAVAVADHRVAVPSELVFADTVVGTGVTRDLVLTNTGAASVTATVTVAAPFTLAATEVRVPAQGQVEVPVGFEPDDYSPVSATLVVAIDGAAHEVAVSATVLTDADRDGADAQAAGGTDCDDGDAAVFPGADERCNQRDDDCDTAVDEAAVDADTYYLDADDDGFGIGDPLSGCGVPTGYASVAGDCDDGAAAVYPGAPETFYDGIDADCADDSDYDADADGIDSDAYGGTDCDDGDDGVYPGAVDTPYDGLDADCSGGSDFDVDGDGVDSADYGGTDCDDADDGRSPLIAEIEDGVDQDCDVLVDEDFVVRGDWVFTEWMPAPTVVDARWVELLNAGAVSRDLAGLRLEAGAVTTLPALAVAPGSRVVLCADGDLGTNGGVPCDLAGLDLATTTLGLYRKTTALDELDTTDWTATAGASFELGAGLGPDADQATDWCVATASFGDGDLGTPGASPSCAP